MVGLFLLSPLAARARNRFDLHADYSCVGMDAVNQEPSLNGWEGSLLWKPSSFFGVGEEATGQTGVLGPYPMNFSTPI